MDNVTNRWLVLMVMAFVVVMVGGPMFAPAISQVQAITVTVPNGDFELIYKPGTTITGILLPAGNAWTQGVGPYCPIDSGEYEFSDSNTGDVADIPGWIGYDRDGWIAWGGSYDRDQTTGNLQGSVANQGNHTPGGLNCYLANGGPDWPAGYSNLAGGLIVSDAPLATVESGLTYTLSMLAKWRQNPPGATPVVLELLADGVALTPSSSVDPVLSDTWQRYTRTYDGLPAGDVTIVLGVGRPEPDGASGTQTCFDDVSLTYPPDVRVVPVAVLVDPATTNEVRTELPESIIEIPQPGATYYVEIWASDIGETNTGLTSVYVDMSFCEQMSVTALGHGTTFSNLTEDGTIQPGEIQVFGGSTVGGGSGIEPEWVRIGWIEMMVEDPVSACTISLRASSNPFLCVVAETRGDIPWESVLLGSVGLYRDCNGNGLPDLSDIAEGTSLDCNGNGIPDECDISDGTSQDINEDGIPDECVTVPNGDFETIYKPGQTIITGILTPVDDSWTQGVGPNCPIITVGERQYDFSDSTTGTVADIPGWLGYDREGWIYWGVTDPGIRDPNNPNLQGSVANNAGNHTPGGLNCYVANGGLWSNPAGGMIVSEASLGYAQDGVYVLSANIRERFAGVKAEPVRLELLAVLPGQEPDDDDVLTPTSLVDPTLTDEWQLISRTYELSGLSGKELKIVVGVGRDATGGQSCFDDVTLSTYDAKVIYVNDNATGANSGLSWDDAFTELQSALDVAAYGDQIWVADGTYLPDYNVASETHTGDRTATFGLISGVAIYGGYAGFGAPDPNVRDIANNITTLSGDLTGDDLPDFVNNGENSYHVVTGSDCDANVILDGFTIIAGNANGDWQQGHYGGGGFCNWYGTPKVINCTFKNNNGGNGGGMRNAYGNATVINCTFIENSTINEGGAGIINVGCSPAIADCTFSGNSAYVGGGMYNGPFSSPRVTGCTFSDNSADGGGGGMCNWTESRATVTNCTFSGNSAYGGGGGMFNVGSSLRVTGCTFSGNSAQYEGGGMLGWESSPTVTNCTFTGNSAEYGGGMCYYYGSPTVSNCILWGNTATSGGNEIYNDTSIPVISYCDIAGCLDGGLWDGSLGSDDGGNIDDDPLFLDADGGDDTPGTDDDNLRLSAGSPCIDAGDNSVVTEASDLDGNVRVVDGDCDSVAVVDMGAYEFGWVYLGDFDGQCDVDLVDFAIMSAAWLSDDTPSANWNQDCDLDNSGVIDIGDLEMLGANWLAGE